MRCHILMVTLVAYWSPAFAYDKTEIEHIIRTLAVKYHVNPDIAVAVAKVESGLNPNAVGGLGELGVFQLRPLYHDVRAGATVNNIKVGLRYLAYVRNVCEEDYGSAWVNCFNHGPNRRVRYPTLFPYYRKVEYQRRTIVMNR